MGQYKYMDVSKLPVGTEFTLYTEDAEADYEVLDDESAYINGFPEEAVNYQFAGEARYRVLEWGVLEAISGKLKGKWLKPRQDLVSITSIFNANYDQSGVTFRLQTGKVLKIKIGHITMSLDELKLSSERRNKRKGRRKTYRGGYQSLRNQKWV